MLTKANENIKMLIREIIVHRINEHRCYCCGLADRENNNYACSGDIDAPSGAIELKCSECKTLYWQEIEKEMLEKYIVK